MKQLLAISLIAVFAAYAYHHSQEASHAVTAVTPPASISSSAPAASSTSSSAAPASPPALSSDSSSSSTPAATPSSSMMGSMMGQYKNGSYTGSVADAFYGNVQVKVMISGGQISDVQFLQHPSDQQTSQIINNQAMPLLSQEAIQAQSANVNGVSGASATSQAFVQSLDAALQQAKA